MYVIEEELVVRFALLSTFSFASSGLSLSPCTDISTHVLLPFPPVRNVPCLASRHPMAPYKVEISHPDDLLGLTLFRSPTWHYLVCAT